MTTEILCLTLATFIGLLQLFLATGAATKQRGAKWNMSSRDQTPPPLTGTAARLDRAFENFKETFPMFVAAVLVVVATQTSGTVTAAGAILYITARALYIPLYVFGVIGIRSLVWCLSILGLLAMLVAPLHLLLV